MEGWRDRPKKGVSEIGALSEADEEERIIRVKAILLSWMVGKSLQNT